MQGWTCLVLLVALLTPTFAAVLTRDQVVGRCIKISEKEELEKCIVNLFNEIKPDFEFGLPEFSLPEMTRIDVTRFNVTDYQNENSYFKMALWNMVLKGMEETHLDSLKLDYESRTAKWQASGPEMFVHGNYRIEAKLSLIPIEGEGTMWTRLKDVTGRGVCKFDLEGDDHHLIVTSAENDLQAKDVTFRLNNLYEDNEILKETAEVFVNENGQEILDLVKPQLRKRLDALIDRIGKDLGRTLPFSQLAGQEHLKKAFGL